MFSGGGPDNSRGGVSGGEPDNLYGCVSCGEPANLRGGVSGGAGCAYTYDLHVHSCLSPCADDDMTVNNIANMAMLCGLDIVALTDHNSLKNCPAFFKACAKAGVAPVAGTELCTREETHALCLFPTLEAGMEFDAYLERLLPSFINNEKIFGRQLILDENDKITGSEPKLLISACDVGLDELPGLMRAYGGVAVPSHIDRGSNSLIANLGFIAPEYEFRCYELGSPAALAGLSAANPILSRAIILYNSDAHSLAGLAGREPGRLALPNKSAASLIKALA